MRLEIRERGRGRKKVNAWAEKGGRKEGRVTLKWKLRRGREGRGKGSGCVVYGRSNASQFGRGMYRSEQRQRPAAVIRSFLPFTSCPAIHLRQVILAGSMPDLSHELRRQRGLGFEEQAREGASNGRAIGDWRVGEKGVS